MTVLTIALALAAPVLAWLLWREWREFRKLKRWASQPRLSDPPEASGAWGEVFTMLHCGGAGNSPSSSFARAGVHRRCRMEW